MLKGMEKQKIITLIAINEVIMFIITSILYALTSGDVSSEVHQSSKWLILLTMHPINKMIVSAPILGQINKKTVDKVSQQQFRKRIIIIGIIAVIIFIVEIVYVKNIQIGIANFAKSKLN